MTDTSQGDDHLSVVPAADDTDAAQDAGTQDAGTHDGGTQAGQTAGGRDERQDAGRDRSIDKRLQKNPESSDARLDAGLDESMDASDPIAATQPGHSAAEPPASSGYDPQAERERPGNG